MEMHLLVIGWGALNVPQETLQTLSELHPQTTFVLYPIAPMDMTQYLRILAQKRCDATLIGPAVPQSIYMIAVLRGYPHLVAQSGGAVVRLPA